LREIFLALTAVRTQEQTIISKKRWLIGKYHYGKKIESKKETGWVFSDLKRARSMLLKLCLTPFISWMIREF